MMNPSPCDRCSHSEERHLPGHGCVDCPPTLRCQSYKVPFPGPITLPPQMIPGPMERGEL